MHAPSQRRCQYMLITIGLTVASLAQVERTLGGDPSWPQFHGPNRDNISRETGLLTRWPAGGPKLLWTARGIGHGFASVAIADGTIYTSGNIDGRTVISALDLQGTVRWQFENGAAWEKPKGGARGTPTIEAGYVYHENPHGDIVCLEAKTARKLWGLNILAQFGSENIRWGLSESLLIDDDRVICSPGGPQTALVALDKQTGRTIWASPSAGDLAGYSSPTLAEHAGLRMIHTMTARAVIAVNADTGDLLWRFEHISPFDENVIAPIWHDGHVFISTRTTGSVLLKVDVAGTRAKATPVWRSQDLDNHHGGVIFWGGYLFGSCVSPVWTCLEWRSGRTMYRARGVGKGSLTCAGGMLYTFGENGRMALVEPTPQEHRLVSQFQIPQGGTGPSWAHPVVCDGRLYVRHGDCLYVYDVRQQ